MQAVCVNWPNKSDAAVSACFYGHAHMQLHNTHTDCKGDTAEAAV
jgi:hypothetical protein